jgi:hypothetical protein
MIHFPSVNRLAVFVQTHHSPKTLLHLILGPFGYRIGFLSGLPGMFHPFGFAFVIPSGQNPTALRLAPLSSGKEYVITRKYPIAFAALMAVAYSLLLAFRLLSRTQQRVISRV